MVARPNGNSGRSITDNRSLLRSNSIRRSAALEPDRPPSNDAPPRNRRRRPRRRGAILAMLLVVASSVGWVVGPVRAANNDSLSFGADQEPTGTFGANDVVRIDAENHLLLVKGNVPGSNTARQYEPAALIVPLI